MTPRILSATSPPTPAPSPERLAALYSFTRAQRDANPDGYAANVKWWGDVIGGALRAGKLGNDKLLLRPGAGVLDALANGSQRPRGLGGVIDTLENEGTLVPQAQYDAATTPLDATPSLASRVASAAVGAAVGAGWNVLTRVVPFIAHEKDDGTLWTRAEGNALVHLPNVRRAAAAWSAHVAAHPPVQYTDGVFSLSGFAAAFADVAAPDPSAPLSDADIRVLVRWLARDAGRIVVDGDIIKITDTSSPISDADRGAVAVGDALRAVDAQVDAAESEAAACEARARKALGAGKRSTAAAYLRSKKQLDELVAKRVTAGEQLRNVRRALNQAKGDAEIMSAYEASTSALASALADPRLSPDHIASTTDALAEVLADQAEIDDAVRIGSQVATGPAADIDEDDLAKELEALVLEEKEEKARKDAAAAAAAKAEAEAKIKAEAEAKVKAEAEAKAKAEAARKEEQAAKEREAKAKAAAAASATATSADGDAIWSDRYEDAQQREREEKERAAAERLAREERMVAAD